MHTTPLTHTDARNTRARNTRPRRVGASHSLEVLLLSFRHGDVDSTTVRSKLTSSQKRSTRDNREKDS